MFIDSDELVILKRGLVMCALFAFLFNVGAFAAETGTNWSLADAGLSLKGGFVGEFAANPSGGLRQGAEFVGQVSAGAAADLDRIFGIRGAQFHIDMADRFGRDLSKDYIGNSIDVQELYGGGMNARLAEVSWEQELFSGRVNVKAGRVSATPEFVDFSSIGCSFQSNATCPVPKLIGRDSNVDIWPVTTWGGRIKAWATDRVYVEAGAYDVNPVLGNHDRNGTDWSTAPSTGTFVPFEAGYATTFSNDSNPRHYKIGGYYDGGNYTEPAGPYATMNGRSAIYGWADQVVWRADTQSEKGLTLFGSALATTSGRNSQDYGLEAGAILRGTFAGRDSDTVGFMVSDQHLSADARRNISLLRARAGGSGTPQSHEVIFEVNYGIQVAPALFVMPNLQYIVNPDNLANPSLRADIPNTFVVGLKLVSDFTKLFGL